MWQLLFTVTGFILKYQWAAVWSVAGQLDEELLGTGQGRDRYSNTETNASLRSPVREGADWEGSSGVLTPPMGLAKSRLPSLFGSLVKERASSSFIRLHLLTTTFTNLTGFFNVSNPNENIVTCQSLSVYLVGFFFLFVCCSCFYFLFNYFSSENCFFKGLVMSL